MSLTSLSHSYVEIKSITWSKDSHGLFDYEHQNNNSTKFQIKYNALIYRSGNEINLGTKKDTKNSEKNIPLAEITCTIQENNNKYFSLKSPQNSQDEIFFIVRTIKTPDNQPKGYEIKPGDLIKLGRNEYQILECKYENPSTGTVTSNLNTFCEPNQFNYRSGAHDKGTKKTCKICFSEEESPNDDECLFITPCKCKGSCEFVHIGCLKVWLNKRLIPKTTGNTLYYHWKKLECEVCKEPLPKVVYYDDKIIPLLNIARPYAPYILMENVCREKKTSKGIYLVQMLPNDQIKLGRGHQCDLRVSDISVSRLHAIIKYEKDQFRIFDNNSKFGTLVLMKEPFVLSSDKIGVQIGRTVISLAHKSNEHLLKNEVDNFENINKISALKTIVKANSSENYEKKNGKNSLKSKDNMGPLINKLIKLEPKKKDFEEEDILEAFEKNQQDDVEEEMENEANEQNE